MKIGRTQFKLLTRDNFRESVFRRDSHKCVVCGEPSVDAHHIIERRLFHDGGYYLENGASLCAKCHLAAESTDISCDDLRAKIGIKSFPLPAHFPEGYNCDKWGNEILPSGERIRGELATDANVLRILSKDVVFSKYVKYPRTPHLPWSPGATADDKILSEPFPEVEVVVTEKMDGQNFTMYSDYCHARSIGGSSHRSQDWIRSKHASIRHEIPEGWRICGESMFAKHSIAYDNLEDYFLVFSIWNDENVCLSWDDTLTWCELLGLHTVPVLYRGMYDEGIIRQIQLNTERQEGYVVRRAQAFSRAEFSSSIAKYVRKDHVQTDQHWSQASVIPNRVLHT